MGWTRGPSRSISMCPSSPRPTWSGARRGRSGCRTSCSGRRRTPSWSSATSSGPTWTGGTYGERSTPTRGGTVATVTRNRTHEAARPPHATRRPPCNAGLWTLHQRHSACRPSATLAKLDGLTGLPGVVAPRGGLDRLDQRGSLHAGGTGSEDLQGVADVGEAVLGRDRVGPAFYGRALHLHRATAGPAHEVVMVCGAAPAVDGLAVLGAEHVDITAVGERLKRPVDRGQPDVLPVAPQQIVNVLGTAEVLERLQRSRHRTALPGRSGATGEYRISARHSGSRGVRAGDHRERSRHGRRAGPPGDRSRLHVRARDPPSRPCGPGAGRSGRTERTGGPGVASASRPARQPGTRPARAARWWHPARLAGRQRWSPHRARPPCRGPWTAAGSSGSRG